MANGAQKEHHRQTPGLQLLINAQLLQAWGGFLGRVMVAAQESWLQAKVPEQPAGSNMTPRAPCSKAADQIQKHALRADKHN